MTTIEVIRREMETDDEPSDRQERFIQKAYKDRDIDAFLVSLCGWTWQTIQDKRKGKI